MLDSPTSTTQCPSLLQKEKKRKRTSKSCQRKNSTEDMNGLALASHKLPMFKSQPYNFYFSEFGKLIFLCLDFAI